MSPGIEWRGGGIILHENQLWVNQPLPYAYDALEPYIDEQTMCLHHDQHLQAYVDHLNEALAPLSEVSMPFPGAADLHGRPAAAQGRDSHRAECRRRL